MHPAKSSATWFSRRSAGVFCMACGLLISGCDWLSDAPVDRSSTVATKPPTSAGVRASRRAFDGAPPVIPHEALGADCTICHTNSGREVPTLGWAPANPHAGTDYVGAVSNCRQCHVFSRADSVFKASNFAGLPQTVHQSSSAFPGGPPGVPHTLLLRENCQACHAGPAARPEIVCSHPERENCRQCHLPIAGSQFTKAEPFLARASAP